MTTFESPLGKKRVPSKPMKEFDIPDDSDNGNGPQFNVDAAISQPGMKKLDMNEIHAFQQKLSGQQSSFQPQDETVIEQEIKQAREMKRTGKQRLTESAKRRLESLLGMVRETHQVPIGNVLFTLQTLTGKETREAIKATYNYDGTVEGPFEMRNQLLARSITSIGGLDFDQFVGSDNIEIKLLFVEELDDIVLNALYDGYLIMTKKAKEKYSINSDTQVQEVISDIKK